MAEECWAFATERAEVKLSALPELPMKAALPPRAMSPTLRALTDPLVVAVFTFAVNAFGIGRPSFWADEAATISASTRPLPDLARLISSLDVVHAEYYLLMHGWFQLAPPTEVFSRVPSCLACGIAAAGVVVLGKLVSDRPTALVAGVLFAVLPRTMWAAVEARSFAMTAMAAVWLTALLVVAARRNIAPVWILYTVVLVVSTMLFIYLILMVLVHCVALLAVRPARSALLGFAAASVTAVASALPFMLYASNQAGQVAWVSTVLPPSFTSFLYQYFPGTRRTAIVAGLLIIAAVCVRPWPSLRSVGQPGARLVIIAIAWIAIPTAILMAHSIYVKPAYLDKYLTFTTPALALLLAVCVRRLAQNAVTTIGLVTIMAIAALPFYVSQRGPYAKQGFDYSAVANLVKARAATGDCLLLDDTVSWNPGPIRFIVDSRPDAFKSLIDVGAGPSAAQAGQLWGVNIAPDAVLDRLANCKVIWTLSQRDPTLSAHEVGAALPPGPRFAQYPAYYRPAELGFRIVERWQFSLSQVTRAVR